jgi:predicted ATPase/DNA-binding SARP family transcriptional activator
MTKHLELNLLGTPEVLVDGAPISGLRSSKAYALLYYLATTAQSHSRLSLAGILWSQWPDSQALMNVTKTLSNLRQIAGDHLLITRASAAFNLESHFRLDIQMVRPLLERRLSELDTGTLQAAVNVYRGDFLDGFYVRDAPEFESWMLRERALWRETIVQAMRSLADRHASRGDLQEATKNVHRVLALEPWREEAHQQLMLLLARSGQRGAALAQYEVCRQLLADELAVEPSQETEALYQSIRRGDIERGEIERGEIETVAPDRRSNGQSLTAAAPLAQSPANNLPVQLTPFVGRAAELAEVVGRLQDRECRLLTLVGPGGIGKTRMALRVAQQLLTSGQVENPFGDGIFFVSLAPVASPSEVISAIAAAIGFQFQAEQIVDVPQHQQAERQLVDFLRAKSMLLVLDNFEHLLDATPLLDDMLVTAPNLKLLVTSREALNTQGEWLYPVEGLAFPEPDALGFTEAGTFDAVQLFVQNARRAQPGFSLEGDTASVVRVCRLVEGMPLAIELAAAWLKALPVQRVVTELERNLDILTARHRNLPERHRSIRAVFEQTWTMLSNEERSVLAKISVFRGGFDLDAAEKVAGATLLNLAALVERALIRLSMHPPGPLRAAPRAAPAPGAAGGAGAAEDRGSVGGRYTIHELLRMFAAEQHKALEPDQPVTRIRHAAYYLQLVQTYGDMLAGKEQRRALRALDGEIDNIRVAWGRAVEHEAWEALDRALTGLYRYSHMRSLYQEAQHLFGQAIDRLEAALTGGHHIEWRLFHRIQARYGALCLSLGAYAEGKRRLQSCLEQYSPAPLEEPVAARSGSGGDPGNGAQDHAFVLRALGEIAGAQGFPDRAEAYLQQSLALSRATGDLVGTAEALNSLAGITGDYANFETGRRLALECLALCRELDLPHLAARTLIVLGWNTNCLGAYGESARYWQESLEISQDLGDEHGVAQAQSFLGWVAWCTGGPALEHALAYFQQALETYRKVGSRRNIAMALGDLALAAGERGDYARAVVCGEEGKRLADEMSHFDMAPYNLYALGNAARVHGDLAAARVYLLDALGRLVRRPVIDHIASVLYYFAELLVAEGIKLDDRAVQARQVQQALALVEVVVVHPATWQPIRDRAVPLQAHLAADLPAYAVSEAQAWAKAHTLEAAAHEIWAEYASDASSAVPSPAIQPSRR